MKSLVLLIVSPISCHPNNYLSRVRLSVFLSFCLSFFLSFWGHWACSSISQGCTQNGATEPAETLTRPGFIFSDAPGHIYIAVRCVAGAWWGPQWTPVGTKSSLIAVNAKLLSPFIGFIKVADRMLIGCHWAKSLSTFTCQEPTYLHTCLSYRIRGLSSRALKFPFLT